MLTGGVLLLERQHHQGQVLAEARQEEQGGLRLPQAHLLFQEGEAPLQGLETGETPSPCLATYEASNLKVAFNAYQVVQTRVQFLKA